MNEREGDEQDRERKNQNSRKPQSTRGRKERHKEEEEGQMRRTTSVNERHSGTVTVLCQTDQEPARSETAPAKTLQTEITQG